MKTLSVSCLLFVLVSFVSCNAGFAPLDYGHDACAYCKMTIIDKRYACEILTEKGRAYKFDDLACLRKYMAEQKLARNGLSIFVADYNRPDDKFLDAQVAVYLHHDIFKSPMNGCYAAFAASENALALKESLNVALLKWENLN